MDITQFITPARIAIDARVGSKKRLLELLSNLMTADQPDISQLTIFESLCTRERLGGTGLGKGVALPHGRLRSNGQILGAFARLQTGIDYDAIDQQPVDLVFALVVPEKSTNEHLEILAMLAQMFSDKPLREQLRLADSELALFDLLTTWRLRT